MFGFLKFAKVEAAGDRGGGGKVFGLGGVLAAGEIKGRPKGLKRPDVKQRTISLYPSFSLSIPKPTGHHDGTYESDTLKISSPIKVSLKSR